MYEQFKHLIMAELSKDFDVDQLRKISECLDLAAKNFDVVKKETQIVPYGQEIPKAVEIYIASKKIEGLSEKVTVFVFDRIERFLQVRSQASGKGFSQ